jgi:hypothetical protein
VITQPKSNQIPQVAIVSSGLPAGCSRGPLQLFVLPRCSFDNVKMSTLKKVPASSGPPRRDILASLKTMEISKPVLPAGESVKFTPLRPYDTKWYGS